MLANLNDFAAKLWQEETLFTAMLELTFNCNYDCAFCYNDKEAIGRKVSVAKYAQLLGELRDMGVLNLVFTGGEPLVSPTFLPVGKMAKEMGFCVKIKTNGHLLSREMVRSIKTEIDPFIVDISIHGANAETHDMQTRVPGSFYALKKGLKNCSREKLRVNLNCPLTKWNVNERDDIERLGERHGFRVSFNTGLTARDNGDKAPLSFFVSKKNMDELEEYRNEKSKKNRAKRQAGVEHRDDSGKQCGIGSSIITVDPFGNVFPCIQWRRVAGNIHDEAIGSIWRNSKELQKVRGLAREVKAWIKKQSVKPKGFCLAQAKLEEGSPFSLYEHQRVWLGVENDCG